MPKNLHEWQKLESHKFSSAPAVEFRNRFLSVLGALDPSKVKDLDLGSARDMPKKAHHDFFLVWKLEAVVFLIGSPILAVCRHFLGSRQDRAPENAWCCESYLHFRTSVSEVTWRFPSKKHVPGNGRLFLAAETLSGDDRQGCKFIHIRYPDRIYCCLRFVSLLPCFSSFQQPLRRN